MMNSRPVIVRHVQEEKYFLFSIKDFYLSPVTLFFNSFKDDLQKKCSLHANGELNVPKNFSASDYENAALLTTNDTVASVREMKYIYFRVSCFNDKRIKDEMDKKIDEYFFSDKEEQDRVELKQWSKQLVKNNVVESLKLSRVCFLFFMLWNKNVKTCTSQSQLRQRGRLHAHN